MTSGDPPCCDGAPERAGDGPVDLSSVLSAAADVDRDVGRLDEDDWLSVAAALLAAARRGDGVDGDRLPALVGAVADEVGVAPEQLPTAVERRERATSAGPAASGPGASSGVYVLDDDLAFRAVGEGFASRVGCTREDLIGEHLSGLAERGPMPPAACERAEREFERVFEGTVDRVRLSLPPAGDGPAAEHEGRVLQGEGDHRRLFVAVRGAGRTRRVPARERPPNHRRELIAAGTSGAILVTDREGRYRLVDDGATELLSMSRPEILAADPTDLFGGAVGGELRERQRGVLEAGAPRTDEETLPVGGGRRRVRTTRAPYYGADGDVTGVLAVVHEVDAPRARMRALERWRDELETVARVDDLLRTVTEELVQARSRQEIEATVCRELADADLYACCWIAERDADGSLRRRDGARDDERLRQSFEAAEDDPHPAMVALRTGEVRTTSVLDDPDLPESVRAAARDHGVRSAIQVPLSYGTTVYGVLVVGSPRPDAFGESEAGAFETLGRTVGLAISAAQNRKLLHADSVIELDLAFPDPVGFFSETARELDCRFSLEWLVPAEDDRLHQYVSVAASAVDPVVERAAADDRIDDVRVVADAGDQPLLEATLTDSLVTGLLDRGATIGTAVADPETSRITARVPPETDVRKLLDAVEARAKDVELVGKREVERPGRSAAEFREDLEEQLTDHQRSTLRTAYHAGYFEWPRESTAEEIAESMDVSSATLHYHLRQAQRKLLVSFFDD